MKIVILKNDKDMDKLTAAIDKTHEEKARAASDNWQAFFDRDKPKPKPVPTPKVSTEVYRPLPKSGMSMREILVVCAAVGLITFVVLNAVSLLGMVTGIIKPTPAPTPIPVPVIVVPVNTPTPTPAPYVTPAPTYVPVITPAPPVMAQRLPTPNTALSEESITPLKAGDSEKVGEPLQNLVGYKDFYPVLDTFSCGSQWYYAGDTAALGGKFFNPTAHDLVDPVITVTAYKGYTDSYDKKIETRINATFPSMQQTYYAYSFKIPTGLNGYYHVVLNIKFDTGEYVTLDKWVTIFS
jgi:uncharacterized protein YsxB (DUF464 family)